MNKVDIRIVRIFNTYGPRMHPFDGRVVSNFIRQALDNQTTNDFGDGSQTRSFCYRDDLLQAMILMMENDSVLQARSILAIPLNSRFANSPNSSSNSLVALVKSLKENCQSTIQPEDNRISADFKVNTYIGSQDFIKRGIWRKRLPGLND